MNSTYRGRYFAKLGRENLRAAIFFCCHVRAAHHSIDSSTRRDLSVFSGLPILDRDAIGREGNAFFDRVKSRVEQAPPPARRQAPRRHRRVPSTSSDDAMMISSSDNASSDVDNPSESTSSSSRSSSTSESSVFSYQAPRNHHVAPPPVNVVRPSGNLAEYVWNAPNGWFDVKIISIDDVNKTATFEYLPPHAHHRNETKPWAQLRPPNDAPQRRRGRAH